MTTWGKEAQPTAESVAGMRYFPLSPHSACVATVASTFAFGVCLKVTFAPRFWGMSSLLPAKRSRMAIARSSVHQEQEQTCHNR